MRIHLLRTGILVLLLSGCTALPTTTPGSSSAGSSSSSSLTHLPYAEVLVKALNGDHSAEFELGAMFHDGDDVAKDAAKAEEWYLKSAKAGNRQAEFNLGLMYLNGDGVTQDLAAAKRLLTHAADAGDVRAAFQLGTMFYKGTDVPQDFTKAYEFFLKAAMGGLAEAQLNVGVMNIRTEGIAKQNLIDGFAWLQLAMEGNNSKARPMYEMLAAKLTDEQRKQGWTRAAELQAEVKKNGG